MPSRCTVLYAANQYKSNIIDSEGLIIPADNLIIAYIMIGLLVFLDNKVIQFLYRVLNYWFLLLDVQQSCGFYDLLLDVLPQLSVLHYYCFYAVGLA